MSSTFDNVLLEQTKKISDALVDGIILFIVTIALIGIGYIILKRGRKSR